MQTLLPLVVWILLGSITAYYAKERGRSQWSWFAIGLLLGILGIVLLFVLPNRRRAADESPALPLQPATPPPPSEVKVEPSPSKFWYYLDPENKQIGPMSLDALRMASQEGKVTTTTYVWNENLEDWKQFSELSPL